MNRPLRQRESRFTRSVRQPIWTDRCTCTHLAAQHGPANGWNLVGACLRCDCTHLAVTT